ncbi:PREDICTED: rab3 GTPase-activating protein non-catalytic subunit-like isoform X1 [Amphimedon queenslandica]|nr:PREDICTED: rab3 GTPase-activating protein non-catalytic subunit-like isoform X1 [Amphimedon queenslandica]|eukprot:XP_019855954.1 PREDICTED: rab3 GTPase-activating protein non-catalytic subunit-like isoform X1 [Amphimedon queenslandica]
MAVEMKSVLLMPKGPLSSILLDEDSEHDIMHSFCPTGRLFAFLTQAQAQFIATEGHPNMSTVSSTLYANSFIGKLDVITDPILPAPLATAVCVLPIALIKGGVPQLSSIVMIGFDDGSIAAYSKSGRMIFMQQLSPDNSVIKIRTMSTAQKQSTSSIIVLFNGGIVCIIDGISLSELIEEKVSDKSDAAGAQTHLIYKKYSLEQQTGRLDAALIGHSLPSYFDHLREASVVDGYESIIKQGPLNEAKLIVVGEQPMISLYRLNKDAGSINVSEVVHEVASRMTNAVLDKLSFASGWLGWGGANRKTTPTSPPQQQEEKQQRSLNIRMSTNIPDLRRVVCSISVSPLADLAALVDEFGRILLLDINNLIIRRMWKGYRGAQCGWLLVSDPVNTERQTQCLCVYLPRRGIIEFWPVQCGLRAGVCSIGRNCTIFYTNRAIFGRGDVIKGLNIPSPSFGDMLMALTPEGHLVTFTVPFSSLVKRNNPLSHDFHILQNLQKNLIKGEELAGGSFENVCTGVKSSQSLLEVIQILIKNYSKGNRSSFTATLDIAINRCTSNKNCSVPVELLNHFKIIKSLSVMYFEIEDNINIISSKDVPVISSLYECLDNFVGMKSKIEIISQLITLYYGLYQSSMNVTPTFSLADFLFCFEVGVCEVSCLLPESTNQIAAGTAIDHFSLDVEIKSDLSQSMLMSLASFIYQVPLLRCNCTGLNQILVNCPVSCYSLTVLLIKYFASDFIPEAEASLILSSLYSILSTLIKKIHEKDKLHSEVLDVLSCTSFVGQALLVALLCQKLMLNLDGGRRSKEEKEEEEEWETVRVEEEVWSILIDQLMILTRLTLITGSMTQPLPPIMYVSDEFEGDIGQMELNPLFKGNQVVSVNTLERCGPVLLTNCIARRIVDKRENGLSTSELWNNPINNEILLELLKMFPHSLSLDNVLVYCAIHSASQWNKESSDMISLSLNYIEYIQSPIVTRGVCSFLWHVYLEKNFFQLLEDSKKTVVCRNSYNASLLWAGRSLLHCLEQLAFCREDLTDTPTESTLIHSPSGILFLHSLIKLFPSLDSTLLSTGIQLLLQGEILLDAGSTLSVFTYYAPVVRSWFKKGLFLSSYKSGDNVGKAVIQKRTKFLNDAVINIIKDREPSIASLVSFSSLRSQPVTQCSCSAKGYTEISLSLSSLWGVSGVQYHWIANLLCAGFTDKGLNIFHSLSSEKESVANQLLHVTGQLCGYLMNNIEVSRQSSVLAQSPPSLLEWIRKQKNYFSFIESKPKCTGNDLLFVMDSLRPHIDRKNENIINELIVFIKLIN